MGTVLTIAGFDPSSGAGIAADLAVFAAHGLFGTSCITALTVQSTIGVFSTHPVAEATVRETLEALEDDLPPEGIKIGMLATAACVDGVAEHLEGLHRCGRRPLVVLDPVIRSTSGRELLDAAGLDRMVERLIPLADWVTPNLQELAMLVGVDATRLQGSAEVLEAAHRFRRNRPTVGIVVTGGQQDPPNDLLMLPECSRDHSAQWLMGERVVTSSTHGTGCAFSSALLSRLVLGDTPLSAGRSAKSYVAEALRSAAPIGHGHGPMNHLWPLRREQMSIPPERQADIPGCPELG